MSKLVVSCCTHSRRSLTGRLLQRPHAVGAGAVGDVTPRHQDHHGELRAVLAGSKHETVRYVVSKQAIKQVSEGDVLYPVGTLWVLDERPN